MQLYPVKTRVMRQMRAEHKTIHDIVNVLQAHDTGSRECNTIHQPGEPTRRSTAPESKCAWSEGWNKRGAAPEHDGGLSPSVRYLHENESARDRYIMLVLKKVLFRNWAHGTGECFIGTQSVRGDRLRDDHILPERKVIPRHLDISRYNHPPAALRPEVIECEMVGVWQATEEGRHVLIHRDFYETVRHDVAGGQGDGLEHFWVEIWAS